MTAPIPSQLTVVVPELENAKELALLTPASQLTVRQTFAAFFVEFEALEKTAKTISVNAPKSARATRLELRAVRIGAEKARKAAGDEALKYKTAIDSIYRILENRVTPLEDRLSNIENAEKLAEAERVAALQTARYVELLPFASPEHYDLGNMPDVQWNQLLLGAKAAKAAQIELAKAEEAKRVAAEKEAAETRRKKEQAEIAERARLKAENDRLAKIAAEEKAAREAVEKKAADERKAREVAEKAAKDKADKERVEALAKAARELAAKEVEAKRERDALEAKAKQERETAEKAAQAERAKREALEAQVTASKKAEEDRVLKENQRALHEKALAEAARKKAADAPSKEKLATFAKTIRGLQVPVLATQAELTKKINEQVDRFAKWVESEAAKL